MESPFDNPFADTGALGGRYSGYQSPPVQPLPQQPVEAVVEEEQEEEEPSALTGGGEDGNPFGDPAFIVTAAATTPVVVAAPQDEPAPVVAVPAAGTAAPAPAPAPKARRRAGLDDNADVDALFNAPRTEKPAPRPAPRPAPAVVVPAEEADDSLSGVAAPALPRGGGQMTTFGAAPAAPKTLRSQPRFASVTVTEPEKVADGVNGFVQYRVAAESTLIARSYACRRRYREFEYLYQELVAKYPGAIVPPLPEKKSVGRFEPEFLEARYAHLGPLGMVRGLVLSAHVVRWVGGWVGGVSRRDGLERMLRRIVAHPLLAASEELALFFEAGTYAMSGAARATDSTGGGAGGKGLFGIFGDNVLSKRCVAGAEVCVRATVD
jgi:hypothetical protein